MNPRTIVSILAVAAAALALAGCMPKTGAAPGPLAESTMEIAKARYADATADDLEKGRQLFLKDCNQCHGYPDLVAFPEAKWPAAAKRMAGKAGMKDADGELLTRFVMVARAAAAAPAPAPAPAPAAQPAPAATP